MAMAQSPKANCRVRRTRTATIIARMAAADHKTSDASSGQSSSQDPLDQLLSGAGADGATTQSATNSDGSTTTTITYADGTTIDMTTPATASDGGKSGNGTDNSSSNSAISQGSANLLQELIKLQSQMLTAATSTLIGDCLNLLTCWSRLASGLSRCGSR